MGLGEQIKREGRGGSILAILRTLGLRVHCITVLCEHTSTLPIELLRIDWLHREDQYLSKQGWFGGRW
ncbi:hypothetical protein M404DRAFT_994370 [Pisolithus tinctorius Marx 270]|uniref:Uncharacterized protein n=1 Tax=Pisolithus tinctorius Marx 270 TaxID=870435 RepID=A0A0C3PCY2_PISTI|nr:hypothetical protein M404DRAFT_994370 [Pisolithus tinctorius Marx 270]